jgi:hypothetical protein
MARIPARMAARSTARVADATGRPPPYHGIRAATGRNGACGMGRKPVWLGGKAEGEGFEPSIRLTTDNGFRDRRIRPLCHPSGASSVAEAEKEGFEPSKEVITPLTP